MGLLISTNGDVDAKKERDPAEGRPHSRKRERRRERDCFLYNALISSENDQ